MSTSHIFPLQITLPAEHRPNHDKHWGSIWSLDMCGSTVLGSQECKRKGKRFSHVSFLGVTLRYLHGIDLRSHGKLPVSTADLQNSRQTGLSLACVSQSSGKLTLCPLSACSFVNKQVSLWSKVKAIGDYTTVNPSPLIDAQWAS